MNFFGDNIFRCYQLPLMRIVLQLLLMPFPIKMLLDRALAKVHNALQKELTKPITSLAKEAILQ